MSATLLPPSLQQPVIGDGSFPAGTPIAVPSADGAPTERPVESLARGDQVLTLSGPVTVRHLTIARQEPQGLPRQRVLPVRVAAGAFGEGQPVADLLLAPEQPVHVLDPGLPGGALVPVGALVNGQSIRREPQSAPLTWVRLELEQPAVVIAAGLLAAARLDPAAPAPAPLLQAGPATAALRQRLAQAGGQAGSQAPLDQAPVDQAPIQQAAVPQAAPALASAAQPADPAPEPAAAPAAPAEPAAQEDAAPAPPPASPGAGDQPALRIVVKGETLPLVDGSDEATWDVMLPSGTSIVRLLSPRGLPANIEAADRAQARRFGVAIRALLLDDAPIPLDGPAIGDGFHNVESAGGESWRWTNGEAVLHLPPSNARRRFTVVINNWHQLLQPE